MRPSAGVQISTARTHRPALHTRPAGATFEPPSSSSGGASKIMGLESTGWDEGKRGKGPG